MDKATEMNKYTYDRHQDTLHALRAIIARIHGDYDHPSLLARGPLTTSEIGDVLGFAKEILAKIDRPYKWPCEQEPLAGDLTPLDIAVALSLYQYNISPNACAQAIYDYYDGHCMELVDLIIAVKHGHAATELPAPSAKQYVRMAIAQYGEEAKSRNEINLTYMTEDPGW